MELAISREQRFVELICAEMDIDLPNDEVRTMGAVWTNMQQQKNTLQNHVPKNA
jgi:hypothetical protein